MKYFGTVGLLAILCNVQSVARSQSASFADLPNNGVLHAVYSSPDLVGDYVFWVDFESNQILFVKGASTILRLSEDRYLHGEAIADFATGAIGSWNSDIGHGINLITVPWPITQRLILRAEPDRVSAALDADVATIQWRPPESEKWVYSSELRKPVQVASAQHVEFRVAADGNIHSWRHVADVPEHIDGPLYIYRDDEQVRVGDVFVPKHIYLTGGDKASDARNFSLKSAEFLEEAPFGAFTESGAIQLAAEAAQPMVTAERKSAHWYGHGSTEKEQNQKSPVVEPNLARSGPSWSVAFIVGGGVVLALGAFAWWRSRR